MALREMMWHSDNARTREVTDKFTDAKINAYAQAIGMTELGIPRDRRLRRHHCRRADTGRRSGPLWRRGQSGLCSTPRTAASSTATWRARPVRVGRLRLDQRVEHRHSQHHQPGGPAGTTAQQKQDYYNAMNVAYKAGNYVICTDPSCDNGGRRHCDRRMVPIPGLLGFGNDLCRVCVGHHVFERALQRLDVGRR